MASSSTLVDLVRIFILSSGTGPFQLGSAVAGFRGMEALTDGATFSYSVQNGSNFEVGTFVYNAGLSQAVRTPLFSSNGNATVAFPAGIQLVVTALAQDLTPAGSLPIVQIPGTGTDVAMSQNAVTNALALKLDGAGVSSLSDIIAVLSVINGATALAAENIAAGDFINIYDNAGVTTVRRAFASNPARFANGFASAAIMSAATGICILGGLNTLTSVATSASEVWLSDSVAGGWTTTPPSASGSIIQSLGPAIAGSGVAFTLQGRILL